MDSFRICIVKAVVAKIYLKFRGSVKAISKISQNCDFYCFLLFYPYKLLVFRQTGNVYSKILRRIQMLSIVNIGALDFEKL